MNPLVKWSTLARRGIVGPAFAEGSLRQAGVYSRWGVGLSGQIRQAAARDPQRLAVVDDTGESLTYAALVARSDRCSKALARLGIGADSRVGVLARNGVGTVLALLGTSGLGGELVVLNTGISSSQLGYLAAGMPLNLLIHDDEFAPAVAAIGDICPTISLSALAEAAAAEGRRPLDQPPAYSGRMTLLTSGTSGVPRGVRRSSSGLVENFAAFLDRVDLRVADTVLVSVPLYHMWGMSALGMTFGVRGTLVLQRRFEAPAAIEAMRSHRVGAHFAVPAMLQRLLDLTTDAPRLPDLRVVASSGSRCPAGMVTDFMGAYGDVLHNIYGTTETGIVTIATATDLRRAPECAGSPPAGIKLALLDDDLHPVADGTVGRVFVGNPMARAGYTDGTAGQVHRGLRFTGDLGHLRDGLLFVDGREDELVICGGESIYPVELERALGHHPDVREVAAIGVPDREFGQRLVAVVVARDGATINAAALTAYARREVSRHGVPRDIVVVDSLPRNEVGKVAIEALRLVVAGGS